MEDEQVFLEVDGVRLHAVSFGSGPRTFVAVGGWTGDWELWEPPFELLTQAGWRCIAYDHRGSGESPADPALLTVAGLVDELAGVLDAFGVERCVLAGESMGGAIAQYAAARDPARFSGLVPVAARPAARWGSRADLRFAELCRADYLAATHEFVDRCLPEPDVEHLRRWGRDILRRAEPEQAARLIEMWFDEDVPTADTAALTMPVVLVHGTADVISPVETSRALAAALPDAELVELDGVGHVPTFTRPGDVVAAVVRRFG